MMELQNLDMIRDQIVNNQVASALRFLGLPQADSPQTSPSTRNFEDGSHYGLELSSANSPEIIEQMLKLCSEFDLQINRFIECRGIVRLTDSDIKSMVELCAREEKGLYLSVGARAQYECGAFSRSKNGARQGYRVVGSRGLQNSLEEIQRAYELGVRGFLIYDEGLLDALGTLRREGLFPADILLKFSVHAGCSNLASARLLERLGADCINPVPDLPLAELAQWRQALQCPLDLFTDTAGDAGGLLRTHEVADFVRYVAPVYLKCGPISQQHQNHLPNPGELRERVRQARCVFEHVLRGAPECRQMGSREPSLAIPRVRAHSSR